MNYRLNLNTQTKLGLLLFANIMVFFHLPFSQEVISVGFLISLIFLSGYYQRALVYLTLFASCFLLDYFFLSGQSGFMSGFLSFYASTFRRLMPLFMMGGFFMSTTKVSDLIYTLRRWHVPNFVVIPLSVLLRFFPTLKVDYQHIRSAMRLRGIGVTNWDMLKTPIQTLEYIVMPLLMSASITAVDLSAASLTRGISNPSKRTSIYARKLTSVDYLVLAIALALIILRGV